VIKVKDGVEFTVIAPAGFVILQALKKASQYLLQDLTITSACDGEHSGPEDPHKKGEAYDIRSHDFDVSSKEYILDVIMRGLDGKAFYGFLEAPGREFEHWHIQRAKGTAYSIEDFLAS
jgi:hypothetical protein